MTYQIENHKSEISEMPHVDMIIVVIFFGAPTKATIPAVTISGLFRKTFFRSDSRAQI